MSPLVNYIANCAKFLLRSCVTESKFAEDTALYTTSHEGFETFASLFVAVAGLWGLTVSLVKSKTMVVGTRGDISLLSPIPVGDGFIDLLEDFQYLGSCISSDGELDKEVWYLANYKAARMFGCLHSSIFVNGSLSIATKRCVLHSYCCVYFGVWGRNLCCQVKAFQVKRLQSFHNRCIRCILGVSCHLQWRDYITTEQLALEFGMTEGMDVLLALHIG